MHPPTTRFSLGLLLGIAATTLAIDPRIAHAMPLPDLPSEGVVHDGDPGSVASESLAPVPVGFVGPDEIRCRGARASVTGNLLSTEQSGVEMPRHPRRGGAGHAACVRRSVLGFAAQEARNRDAGTALLFYWSLAEAMHSKPVLDSGIATADQALKDHATVAARGLELPVDRTVLLDRRLTLEDKRIALDIAIETLTKSVQLAADLPPIDLVTARPGQDESQLDEALDEEALVAEAMASRPELRMIRMLQSHLDADTAPVARTALAAVSPALGGGGDEAKPCGLILGRLGSRGNSEMDVLQLRRQLRQLRQSREAAVADEVRRAAIESGGNAERVRAARARLKTAEQSLVDLRAKQPTDGSDAFAMSAAELEVAAAGRSVIERLAAWERSRVALWQAQGILARDCGTGGF